MPPCLSIHALPGTLWLMLALAACQCTPPAAPPQTGRTTGASASVSVELVRTGPHLASQGRRDPVALDTKTRRALVQRVERALAVCNFTSETRPEIFEASARLAALWQTRQRGAHLRLIYAPPKTLQAVAGTLVISEVMLSLGQAQGPEPALLKGPRGDVVGLKKCGYDDRFLGCTPDLRSIFARPAACPPGL